MKKLIAALFILIACWLMPPILHYVANEVTDFHPPSYPHLKTSYAYKLHFLTSR